MASEGFSGEGADEPGDQIAGGDTIRRAFGLLQSPLLLNLVACLPAEPCAASRPAPPAVGQPAECREQGSEAYHSLLPKLAVLAEAAPTMTDEDYSMWVDTLPFGEFIEYIHLADAQGSLLSAISTARLSPTKRHRQD